MVVLKGCPRCHGDLSSDRDGTVACIQCGHETLPSNQVLVRSPFHVHYAMSLTTQQQLRRKI